MAGSPSSSPVSSERESFPLLGGAPTRPAGIHQARWKNWCNIAEHISTITGENVWDVIGAISTTLAMIPQGYFGMLLMDFLLLQKLALRYRIPLDIAFFVGSEEGKRQLIRFFNEGNFKGLAHKEWIRDCDPRTWTGRGILLGLETFIASLTFGGLTLMANDGAAGLLESYNLTSPGAVDFVNTLALIFRNRWFNLPFMLASTGANFLTFPYMVTTALKTTRDTLLLPLENPAHWHAQEAWYEEVEAVRLCLKDLFKEGYVDEYNTILRRLLKNPPIGVGDLPINFPPAFIDPDCGFNRNAVHDFFEQMKRILAVTRMLKREVLTDPLAEGETIAQRTDRIAQAIGPNEINAEYEKIRHYRPGALYKTLRAVTTMSVVAATAMGLWNFKEISVDGFNAIRKMFLPFIPVDQIPQEIMGILTSIFKNVIGWGSFGAMAALSLTIMKPTTEEVFDSIFGGGRGRSINVLSPLWFGLLVTLTAGISALSGGPNAYQALIEGENPTMMAFAYVASIFLESMGIWALSSGKRIAQLPSELRRIKVVDVALMELSKTYQPGADSPLRFRDCLQEISFFQGPRVGNGGIPAAQQIEGDEEEIQQALVRPAENRHRNTCCTLL